jgi:hypothetical protein
MNQRCASNVISLLCLAAFKECKEVEDPATNAPLWLPSLMCRSECEARKKVWDECVGALEFDAVAKSKFDAAMLALVSAMEFSTRAIFNVRLDDPPGTLDYSIPFRELPCDSPGGDLAAISASESVTSFLHGQYPLGPTQFGTYSWAFPPQTSAEFLYPEAYSVHTTAAGFAVRVPCFVPGKPQDVVPIHCPAPFVNALDSLFLSSCVKPCPVPIYTEDELRLMWVFFCVIGVVGLCLNAFTLVTWSLNGQGKQKTSCLVS